tara:strand:+ start:169 stop:867 length:699 start_codon:yes stop_codon:yes gene_type:complete
MKNKKYICIIPARAGSKGIKNKNIAILNGLPLVQHSINTAKKLRKYCDIVVSTNSPKVKKIITRNSLPFFGFRPEKLSSDFAQTKDVVSYELKKLEKKLKKKYFGILLLQPTCPIRDYKKIISSFKIIEKKKFDSVVSITNVNANHPYRMKVIRNGYLKNFMKFKSENMIPRQKLPKIFIRSGSFYIIKRDVFSKRRSLVGKKTYGFKLEGLESTNIDTINDLKFLKCILEK